MHRHTIATATTAAGLLAATLLLTGCSTEPDIAACKTAMEDQLVEGVDNPGTKGTRPAACEGVDAKTLERLAGEALASDRFGDKVGEKVEEQLATPTPDTTFSPTAEQRYVWDEAWAQTDPEQQKSMCDHLHDEGPVVVGNAMKGDNPNGEEVDMARYILAEKC